MQQHLNRHGKQIRKITRVIAVLYVVCNGRDGHEKEDFMFLSVFSVDPTFSHAGDGQFAARYLKIYSGGSY